MRKIYIAWFVSLVVAAFLSVSASVAFAAPEWLINGSPVTSLTSILKRGSATMTDLKASFLGASSVECSGGSAVGAVNAAGAAEITEVIDSKGHKYTSANTSLGTTALECKGVAGCEGEALLWPIGLPWLSQLELSGTAIVQDAKASSGEIGVTIECSIFGIKEEDTCTQALFTLAFVENQVEGTLWRVKEENASHCSLSGENSGDLTAEGTKAPLTGTLAVSGE